MVIKSLYGYVQAFGFSLNKCTFEFRIVYISIFRLYEAGKSSILEAINAFEEEIINRENLNFEEESKGNTKQSISITYSTNSELFNCYEKECIKLVDENKIKSTPNIKIFNNEYE